MGTSKSCIRWAMTASACAARAHKPGFTTRLATRRAKPVATASAPSRSFYRRIESTQHDFADSGQQLLGRKRLEQEPDRGRAAERRLQILAAIQTTHE